MHIRAVTGLAYPGILFVPGARPAPAANSYEQKENKKAFDDFLLDMRPHKKCPM
jgi:hypothetical protein